MKLKDLYENTYHKVASSWVDEIFWKANDLYVRLLDGKEYVYFGFEEDRLDDFLAAQSPGQYMNYDVKPYYDYRRIR